MPQLDILILFDEIFLISIAFVMLFFGIAVYFLPRILFKNFITEKVILANNDNVSFFRTVGLKNYEFFSVELNSGEFSLRHSALSGISVA